MSWLKKIFGSGENSSPTKTKSQTKIKIKLIQHLTEDAVKVIFAIPEELKKEYQFLPGQYVNVVIEHEGKEVKRSYSICSGVEEDLAIGVRKIEGGIVSTYFKDNAKEAEEIMVTYPIGNFTLPHHTTRSVAVVGGSGITPVLSIAKSVAQSESGKFYVLYGNRTPNSMMFQEEIAALNEKIEVTHLFSEEQKEGALFGMLTEEVIMDYFKSIPDFVGVDHFFLCGPEKVIINAKNVLERLGVSEDKIHYELFTTPEELKPTTALEESTFKGISKVTIILDGEQETFDLASDGDTILEEAESYGVDAPYSCRGGVCCTCKGKVLKGSATMEKNYTLSDKEVKEGYILTCQAHPNSPEVIISYDE